MTVPPALLFHGRDYNHRDSYDAPDKTEPPPFGKHRIKRSDNVPSEYKRKYHIKSKIFRIEFSIFRK